MQVEITKVVYNTLGMFPQLSSSQTAGWGGLFISPIEKVAVRDETQLSATDRTCPVVPTVERARRDRMHYRVRSSSIGRGRSHLRRSGTSMDMIGRCTLCVRSSSAATTGHTKNIAVTKNSVICVSDHYFAQHPVTAADA